MRSSFCVQDPGFRVSGAGGEGGTMRRRTGQGDPTVQGYERSRCRENMAHIRQSRPDYGLGFQGKVLKPSQDVPSSLGGFEGRGCHREEDEVGCGMQALRLKPLRIEFEKSDENLSLLGQVHHS